MSNDPSKQIVDTDKLYDAYFNQNSCLPTCLLDFVLGRNYDREKQCITYICNKRGLCICISVEDTCKNNLTNIDEKALRSISPYCRGCM